MTYRSLGALGAALVVGGLAAAQAQTPGTPGGRDIMPELLAEVRGLRAAIELMTASSSRVQLALGRLQLQEQRLSSANGRLAEVRSQLGTAQRGAVEMQERAASLENMVSGSTSGDRGECRGPKAHSPGEHIGGRGFGRRGALGGSQPAARRSRTVAPSREIRIRS